MANAADQVQANPTTFAVVPFRFRPETVDSARRIVRNFWSQVASDYSVMSLPFIHRTGTQWLAQDLSACLNFFSSEGLGAKESFVSSIAKVTEATMRAYRSPLAEVVVRIHSGRTTGNRIYWHQDQHEDKDPQDTERGRSLQVAPVIVFGVSGSGPWCKHPLKGLPAQEYSRIKRAPSVTMRKIQELKERGVTSWEALKCLYAEKHREEARWDQLIRSMKTVRVPTGHICHIGSLNLHSPPPVLDGRMGGVILPHHSLLPDPDSTREHLSLRRQADLQARLI